MRIIYCLFFKFFEALIFVNHKLLAKTAKITFLENFYEYGRYSIAINLLIHLVTHHAHSYSHAL